MRMIGARAGQGIGGLRRLRATRGATVKFNRRIQVPLMALALGGLVMASATAAGAAPGKPPAAGGRKPVIVGLRNPPTQLPAQAAAAPRRSPTQSEQAP